MNRLLYKPQNTVEFRPCRCRSKACAYGNEFCLVFDPETRLTALGIKREKERKERKKP
jgi:hypothetical protein